MRGTCPSTPPPAACSTTARLSSREAAVQTPRSLRDGSLRGALRFEFRAHEPGDANRSRGSNDPSTTSKTPRLKRKPPPLPEESLLMRAAPEFKPLITLLKKRHGGAPGGPCERSTGSTWTIRSKRFAPRSRQRRRCVRDSYGFRVADSSAQYANGCFEAPAYFL
jgi:hypothetical protein